MMSCIAISQDLAPKIQSIENEKHYCFTIAQSRSIAKLLELGKYNDSLVHSLSKQVARFELLTTKKDSVISFQSEQLENYAMIVGNNEKAMQLLETRLEHKDKKLKRGKLQKVLLGVGVVVLGILAISK